jgi:transcription antitermination factor NusG
VNWFCIHTRPKKESQVATLLRDEIGREVYLPRLRLRRTIRRVKRVVITPLFPRYLFCRMDMGLHYRSVRYAKDVIEVVRFGEHAAVVPDSVIEELRRWAGEAVDTVTLEPELREGDMVEIADGPMRGLRALIVNMRNDRDRVTVLLTMLRHGAQMVIGRSQLIRATGVKAGDPGPPAI